MSEKMAEIIGIILGDGNIYINSQAGVYQIRIGLNSRTEKEYALNYILPLLEKTLKVKCTWSIAPKNEIFIRINKKDVVLKINQLINKRRVPKNILGDQKLLRACIRGLVDTDGSVFSKTTNKFIPQIEFYQKR